MIPVADSLFAQVQPLAVGERFADGTRREWENAALRGLFESHLQGPQGPTNTATALAGDAPVLSDVGGAPIVSDSAESTSLDVPSAIAAEGESSGTAAPVQASAAAQPKGGVWTQGVEVPASGDEGGNGAQLREAAEGFAQLDTGTLQQAQARSLVLALDGDRAELYVRDATLDGESGLALVRAADTLLQGHRLHLGRARINGQPAPGEGDEVFI